MEMPIVCGRSNPSCGTRKVPDILCQCEGKYQRSREDDQVEKCQLTLEVRAMLEAQNLVVPIANSFCRQLPLRNRGTPTRPSILLLRACDNRLSWFSFSISANQLRSVLCSQLADGLATSPFLGGARPVPSCHKKLHSFKPSKRQIPQCPAASPPPHQPSRRRRCRCWVRRRCPYPWAGRDRQQLN